MWKSRKHQIIRNISAQCASALSEASRTPGYTYNVRDRVFPMQTGKCGAYEPASYDGESGESPCIIFSCNCLPMGVFVAERVQQKYKYRAVSTGVRIVALEIAILFLVGIYSRTV